VSVHGCKGGQGRSDRSIAATGWVLTGLFIVWLLGYLTGLLLGVI
jgi:hypothetical protein